MLHRSSFKLDKLMKSIPHISAVEFHLELLSSFKRILKRKTNKLKVVESQSINTARNLQRED